MARPLAQHLNDKELAALASQHTEFAGHVDTAEPLPQDSPLPDAALHARSCRQCELKLRMHRDMQDVLRNFRAPGRSRAISKCPGATDWNAVVAGILPDNDALPLLRHSAECPLCAAQLRQAIALLSPDATPQEEALLDALPTSTQHWRDQTALLMHQVATPHAPPPRLRWASPAPLTILVAAASLTVAVAFTLIWVRSTPTPSADALLTQAYTQNRVTDLRFRGAAYAPLREIRGAQPSSLAKPLPLLEAEVLVARNLARNPDDPAFLDAGIKANILDGNFDAAVRSVAPPRTVDPSTITLATDLATAFYMHAEATGDKEELAQANELLDSILQVYPSDTTALFNSAIVKGKLDLNSLALETWDKFLRLETDPAWKQEGQAKSDALRHALQQRDRSSLQPLRDPAQALPALTARASGAAWSPALDESYLQIALTQWLPTATRSDLAPTPQQSSAQQSLQALAAVLRTHHRDDWLIDLLSSRRSPSSQQGIYELSLAASANAAGDLPALIEHAQASLADFHRDNNIAGETAARLEYATGLTRSQQSDRCLPVILTGSRQVRPFRYPWVETNLLLQLSTCYGIRGDPHRADDSARLAAALADQSSYENLRLYSLYYLDGVTAPWVASTASWGHILDGLNQFWSSQHPPEYGALFYCDMAMGAESQSRWHVAEDAAREAVLLYAQSGNRVDEAGAHHYLAQAAEAAGDPQLADAEYRRAEEMFSHATPQDTASRATLAIERASLELRENRIASASALLNQLGAVLPALRNTYAQLSFYETLGQLHLRSGQPALAEQDLLRAVRLVESSGLSFASEDDRLVWHRYNSGAWRTLLEIYSRVQHDGPKSFAFEEWYRGAPLRAINHRLVGPGASQDSLNLSAALAPYAPDRLHVPRGSAILSWIAFPSGLALWLDDDQGPTLIWQNVPSDQLDATVARFAARCADSASDPRLLHADARRLYSWLVRPFQSRLQNSSTLIIESDPSIAAVPFPALETPDGRYLAAQFRIVESPGIDYARNLHRDAAFSTTSVALSIGNPQLGQDLSAAFPPLPDAETEAAAIAADFRHHMLLTGAAATRSRVVQLLPRVAILHYAGHALLNPREPGLLLADPALADPVLSGPALAGPGPPSPAILAADQFRTLDLEKLQLAVLSACDTANTDQGLAGPGNLVRAFLSSGVPHVVASKWRVDSRVTSQLMTDFYSRLVTGDSVPDALTAAEARIRSHPETAHPYYWAAFASFGS